MDHVFVALPGGADGAGSYEKTFLRDANGKWFWYSYALKPDQTMDLVPRPEH